MSPHSVVFLLIHLWAAMQDGLAVPLMEQDELELPLPKETKFRTRVRTRTRRCACSNQLDSECHYFCHLDIIWVNTPSKKTLDGLGSLLARRRRSASRCACASPADKTCSIFCRDSLEQSSSDRLKTPRPNPLSILRPAVGAARSFQDAVNPEGREDAGIFVENALWRLPE